MEERPAKELEKIWVRLPDGMRERLAEAAREKRRSVNAEVVERLEQSFEPRIVAASDGSVTLDELVDRLADRIQERGGGPVSEKRKPKQDA